MLPLLFALGLPTKDGLSGYDGEKNHPDQFWESRLDSSRKKRVRRKLRLLNSIIQTPTFFAGSINDINYHLKSTILHMARWVG
jgi:hypothetical protein